MEPWANKTIAPKGQSLLWVAPLIQQQSGLDRGCIKGSTEPVALGSWQVVGMKPG